MVKRISQNMQSKDLGQITRVSRIFLKLEGEKLQCIKTLISFSVIQSVSEKLNSITIFNFFRLQYMKVDQSRFDSSQCNWITFSLSKGHLKRSDSSAFKWIKLA